MLRLRTQGLSPGDAVAYLEALSAVAAADGGIEEAERSMFEATMSDLGLAAEARDRVRRALEVPPDPRVAVRDVGTEPVRRLILRDAYLMAQADGEISAAERDVLQALRHTLHLGAADAAECEAWVREGLAWLERGDEMIGLGTPRRRPMF
jgi:tellurite resistance protein